MNIEKKGQRMTEILHAHIDTYSVDCDGPISRSYVVTMDNDERENENGDYRFHSRIVGHVVNAYSLAFDARLAVTKGDVDSDTLVTLEWSEPTEEGFCNMTARICRGDCDTEETSYRDHRAESMGY